MQVLKYEQQQYGQQQQGWDDPVPGATGPGRAGHLGSPVPGYGRHRKNRGRRVVVLGLRSRSRQPVVVGRRQVGSRAGRGKRWPGQRNLAPRRQLINELIEVDNSKPNGTIRETIGKQKALSVYKSAARVHNIRDIALTLGLVGGQQRAVQ